MCSRRALPRRRSAAPRVSPLTTARAALVPLLLLTVACNLPRDPDRTLNRVTHGTMRVGIVHNPPWVIDSGIDVTGVEAAIVKGLAHELGARVEWERGPAPRLFEKLHDRELQLLIGGFTDTLPWRQQVAFTRPYYESPAPRDAPPSRRGNTERHVLAAAPGENAWLVRVEQALHARQAAVPAALAAERQ